MGIKRSWLGVVTRVKTDIATIGPISVDPVILISDSSTAWTPDSLTTEVTSVRLPAYFGLW